MMNTQRFLNKVESLKTFVPSPQSGVLELTIPLHLFYIRMRQGVITMLERHYELINSELDVLVSLRNAPETEYTLSPTQLYDCILFSSGGMTKMLKRLEERGYIERIDNPKDKRNRLVRLTETGKETVEKALNDVLSYENDFFAILSPQERKTLSTLFYQLARGENPESTVHA